MEAQRTDQPLPSSLTMRLCFLRRADGRRHILEEVLPEALPSLIVLWIVPSFMIALVGTVARRGGGRGLAAVYATVVKG